jgi:FkbM family methyltransferase
MTKAMQNLQGRRFFGLINTLLVLLQNFDVMGKHKLYVWLSKHYSHKVISHKLAEKEFVVPVDEWCFWLERGPQNYYLDEFVPFFNAINTISKPFTFFDLGADIGTVSALSNKYCPNLHAIYAFEPNKNSFQLLQHNLSGLGKNTLCTNGAVSNFSGHVAFNSSSVSTIDHEGSINVSKSGDTPVYSLDSWLAETTNCPVMPFVVLKIDVEGQELQVIQGATDLIKQADTVAVLLEIHPDVLKQTSTTAEQLFSELEKIRGFQWCVPKLNNQVIDRGRDFFEQFPLRQFDVIGMSVTVEV